MYTECGVVERCSTAVAGKNTEYTDLRLEVTSRFQVDEVEPELHFPNQCPDTCKTRFVWEVLTRVFRKL